MRVASEILLPELVHVEDGGPSDNECLLALK